VTHHLTFLGGLGQELLVTAKDRISFAARGAPGAERMPEAAKLMRSRGELNRSVLPEYGD